MFERLFNKKKKDDLTEDAEFIEEQSSNEEIKELINTAIGPAPWYWNTFPAVRTKNGNLYKWNYDKEKAEWIPFLSKDNADNGLVMIANSYMRAFALPSGELGVWYPKSSEKPYKFLSVEFEFFDVEKLDKYFLDDIPKGFKNEKNKRPYFCIGKNIRKFSIPSNLKSGRNKFKFPDILKQIDEFIFVCGYPYEKAARSIIQLLPKKNQIVLFPQHWFNGDDFDLGYEWITRVIKHPKTGIIYGDGIRVNRFELEKDNITFKKWIR